MTRATGANAPIAKVPLALIAREWGRIGVTGVGGPPAHIALLRRLVVERRRWWSESDFEHAIAAANLLPGPASTQLMIYSAWRLRGWRGAVLGGLCFIGPGLILIVALSALFFVAHPSRIVRGAALGAGAVVPAIAARTAWQLVVPSWRNTVGPAARIRWSAYGALGVTVALVAPALVVLALLASGAGEVLARRPTGRRVPAAVLTATHGTALGGLGGLGALVWVAFKVGALSYGGGFVIIPLMQHDVVSSYHWMSGTQFLNAVALGQITPGPVVLTVSAVGYAARGLTGAVLATFVAFCPSFLFVLVGARYFERLRRSRAVGAFLAGAGPAVTGAIGASAITLTTLLNQAWQWGMLAAAAGWVLGLHRSPTVMLLVAAVAGALLSGVVLV